MAQNLIKSGCFWLRFLLFVAVGCDGVVAFLVICLFFSLVVLLIIFVVIVIGVLIVAVIIIVAIVFYCY